MRISDWSSDVCSSDLAKDYVRMQWMMLQQDNPQDYVIATGQQYSVREFIRWSAQELGVTLKFEGQSVEEKGIVESVEGDKKIGRASCRERVWHTCRSRWLPNP